MLGRCVRGAGEVHVQKSRRALCGACVPEGLLTGVRPSLITMNIDYEYVHGEELEACGLSPCST